MTDTVSTCAVHGAARQVERRGRHLVVDMHCHLNVRAADDLIRARVAEMPPLLPFVSQASIDVNVALFPTMATRFNGVEQRLQDMDALGVDVQAMSPSPTQYFYFAEPEIGRDAARTVNDGIAAAVATHPDRFVGMGTVPLQHTDMAIAEMRRCVKDLDLRGIEINTNVNGRELADPEFRPFFAAAEELGIVLFLHTTGFTQGERLAEHYFINLIGNPLDSTIAVSHLIFGGVLEAHPGLKLVVAHGGGYLPAYRGRMDHAFRARADCRQHISRPPSDYLKRIWVDSLVFDSEQLESLVRMHGADRICLGTDYPFDMSEPDPVGFHAQLSDEDQRRILGGNAAELLGLTLAPADSR